MLSTERIARSGRVLRISDLQAFYLMITTIFILTGFLYNFIYFRFFGVRVEQFFTLQDYLAASIEKIYLIILAILFATVSGYVARYFIQKKQKLLHHRIIVIALYCFPVIIFITGILMLIWRNEPLGYFILSFAVYISSDFFLFKFIFRSNHDSYSRYFYITVFIFYVLLTFSTAIYDRDSVMSKPVHSLKNYKVHFTGNISINSDECIVLEANSNFFFFYDKQLNKSYVIPKEGISYIEANR
jgi:hypothetical protein